MTASYGELTCLICGWIQHGGMDRETARKEVEREARKLKRMKAQGADYYGN